MMVPNRGSTNVSRTPMIIYTFEKQKTEAMSLSYIVGLITGAAAGIIIIVLAINGRKWYNQLFHRNKQ
jgi:hypothetical protein